MTRHWGEVSFHYFPYETFSAVHVSHFFLFYFILFLSYRNKAEKDRRLREKNQNNTKKFIDERKAAAMKQGKEKEKLQKAHEQQLHDLTRDIQQVIWSSLTLLCCLSFSFIFLYTLNSQCIILFSPCPHVHVHCNLFNSYPISFV